MLAALTVIFLFSAFQLIHSYLLYPVIVFLLSRTGKQNTVCYEPDSPELPHVHIVFSAYNEEKVIAEKLKSIFDTTYPLLKFDVHIGSDNSTDKTNEIVQSFAARYPNLHFTVFEGRNGKSNVLNKLITKLSEGKSPVWEKSILLMTDANVMFTPTLFYQLVKHFKNEAIGLVGANVINRGMQPDGISTQEQGYIRAEILTKYHEGLMGGMMIGAFGACYAMRAVHWQKIPSNFLMEDFYLSMGVLSKKQQAILELEAKCYEDVPNEVAQEFARKTRIQAGNFQNLSVYYPLLLQFNKLSYCFWSHKVARWLGPLWILCLLCSSLLLLNLHWVFMVALLVQVLLLLTPFLDKLLSGLGIHFKWLRYAAYFVWMNIALVKGFWMYRKGVTTNAWSPTKRNV